MGPVARRWMVKCRPAVGVLAACAAVLGGVATATAGRAAASASRSAASASRSAAAGPSVRSRGVLAGVSCLPSRWCMAVGSSDAVPTRAVAWVWQRGAWRQLADPPGGGLTGVSCSARTFCVATGARGSSAALRWNGAAWQVMNPPPRHAVTAPSCPSSAMCALVNGTGLNGSGAIAETWNGQTWKSWTDTSFCTSHPSACGVLDVSCATATTCVAVGFTPTASRTLPRAAVWDGSNWHTNNPPAPARNTITIPSAVSCAGAFCLTIGNAARRLAYVASYHATTGTWTNVTAAARLPWPAGACGGACYLPGTLSCASRTSCMTAGLAGFFAWNGRRFTPAHPVSAGRGSKLVRVSCVKAFCVAVGFRTVNHARVPLSELWNGTTWKILRQA